MRIAILSFILSVSLASAANATMWGGITIANDGWSKGYWNYSDLDQLKAQMESDCKNGSTLPNTCGMSWVSDNNWAAGIYCESSDGLRWGVSTYANTAKQAISAVYQKAISNTKANYVKADCKLKNLVAGNGANRVYKK